MVKLSLNVITRLQVGKPIAVGPIDFNALKATRQLLYNQGKKFPGSVFETESIPSIDGEGLFILKIERKSWGVSPEGKSERTDD